MGCDNNLFILNSIICKLKQTLAILLIFVLAAGLMGCKVNKQETSANAETGIMDLIALSHYFNGAPKKLVFGEATDGTFSDQGVTIKYLASFFDGEATYLFFELTDNGANLFPYGSSGFKMNKYDFTEKDGYNDSRDYRLLSYDKKTKTETICVEYIGPLHTEDLSFHIYSMNGNQQKINAILSDIDLYQILQQAPGEFEKEEQFRSCSTSYSIANKLTGAPEEIEMPEFEEGNQAAVYRLKKDAMSVPIKDKLGNHIADITNVGWKDGWLHVQINPDNQLEWRGMGLNLEDMGTGELKYSPYHMTFGMIQDGQESVDYYEYVFYVGNPTKENLSDRIAFINQYYNATNLKGDWKIRFSIPDAMLKKMDINSPIPVNGHDLHLKRAVASPVNISLFASAKDIKSDEEDWFRRLSQEDLVVKAVDKDGNKVTIPQTAVYLIGNQKGEMIRIKYTADSFDDLAGVEVNGVLLTVE